MNVAPPTPTWKICVCAKASTVTPSSLVRVMPDTTLEPTYRGGSHVRVMPDTTLEPAYGGGSHVRVMPDTLRGGRGGQGVCVGGATFT